MSSAELKVIFQLVIHFIQTLVLALESSDLLPPFLDLVNPDSEDILSLADVLGDVAVLDDLVLSGPLVMERLALVFFGQGSDLGDVLVQTCNLALGLTDL